MKMLEQFLSGCPSSTRKNGFTDGQNPWVNQNYRQLTDSKIVFRNY